MALACGGDSAKSAGKPQRQQRRHQRGLNSAQLTERPVESRGRPCGGGRLRGADRAAGGRGRRREYPAVPRYALWVMTEIAIIGADIQEVRRIITQWTWPVVRSKPASCALLAGIGVRYECADLERFALGGHKVRRAVTHGACTQRANSCSAH